VESCDRLLVRYEGQAIANLQGDDLDEETIIPASMKGTIGWGDAGKGLGFGIVLSALLIVHVSGRRVR
jgi:hypothetical protein